MSGKQGNEIKTLPRILLVDDTEINRAIFGGILSAAHFEVDVVSNGKAAYEATWVKPYDLVLMDVEMPGMNGFEAAARIRGREGIMSGVPIAALTATVKPDAEHYSFWSGIDAFITKPIAPDALVRCVCQIIAEQRSRPNDWKPVWRLGTFSTFTERLDDEESESYLMEFSRLLTNVASFIDAGSAASEEFCHTVHKLSDLSSRLGFEEVAGLCAFYRGGSKKRDGRSRDPNLLGAIERAIYAIASYRREKALTHWWARARTGVQSFFRGVAAA